MNNWNRWFNELEIPYLRSPTFFHPHPFDEHALLEYAENSSRMKDCLPAEVPFKSRYQILIISICDSVLEKEISTIHNITTGIVPVQSYFQTSVLKWSWITN
jgi:hypothetical protein